MRIGQVVTVEARLIAEPGRGNRIGEEIDRDPLITGDGPAARQILGITAMGETHAWAEHADPQGAQIMRFAQQHFARDKTWRG